MSTQTFHNVVRSPYHFRGIWHRVQVWNLDNHRHLTRCQRMIPGHFTGAEGYADGTPMRICKQCERATS